jgi:3-dehydrotetronate 4-kinase
VPGGILLGAVADDVTGGTDLCSVLVREGMRPVQTIGVTRDIELPPADAVVVALKSRTAPVADAVSQSVDALAWLRELGARRFFFKICSTFDSTPEGNIGPVADALLDELGAGFAVVTPAYPGNRRTVYQGHLFVGDRLLSESPMARHPLTPMTDADLVRVLGRQTRRRVGLVTLDAVRGDLVARVGELRAAGVTYAIADAVEDDDLRALAAATPEVALLVGGAGLALGLPHALGVESGVGAAPTHADGPAIVLAGSCSAATREQVARMAERHPAVKVDVVNASAETVAAEALPHLAGGAVLVYTSAAPEEVARVQERLGASKAGAAAEALLAEVARRAVDAGARRVVVAGGETSGAVMQALGIRALAVGAEIAPGVPWMTSVDEPHLALALKSGNFGGPDFFLEALAS